MDIGVNKSCVSRGSRQEADEWKDADELGIFQMMGLLPLSHVQLICF